jgi:high-affinity K+ transport system ATPase subunit B
MKKYIFIGLCNLIDVASTLYLCLTQSFVELNPIVNVLLQKPIIFVIVKIGLITLILIRLWKDREEKGVKIIINIGCLLYELIALYYAVWFIILLLM